METWTIQKLLNWITRYFTDKDIDSPRLSAELLLSQVLGLKRIELYTKFEHIVPADKLDVLHNLVKRAGEHEPIAYLTGRSEFYSIEFEMNGNCLIPRPETELLVELAVDFLRARQDKQFVCDLCTGCGCIAVAIAKNVSNCRIIATDISDAALGIAAKNVARYGLDDRITLLCGDLFEPIVPHLDVDKFDLIVCNPPYVSTVEYQTLASNIRDYEPSVALLAGSDGLDVIRRVIAQAANFLKAGGALMFEIGQEQAEAVMQLLNRAGCFANPAIHKDTGRRDRVVTAIK